MKFSQFVRARRQYLHLTQADVAGLAAMKVPHLSHIEAGREAPSADLTVRMALALKVDADFLVAKAGRIPPDVAEAFALHPDRAARMFRRARTWPK